MFYWNRVYKLGHGGLGGKVCSLNFPWRLNSAVIDAASFAARLTGHTKRLLFGPCLSATVFERYARLTRLSAPDFPTVFYFTAKRALPSLPVDWCLRI